MHIYIHIPFCKQACYYCDFHFSTSLLLKQPMVEAICQEIRLQKLYLQNPIIDTVYFGGGTPSLLAQNDLAQIMDTLHQTFSIKSDAEITMEANPDDLSWEKVAALQKLGINRLSVGIQSFNEGHLQKMNRAHNAHEAENCVKIAQDAGIQNITIDLIYAIPSNDHQILYSDIQKAISLNLNHISAYCLTIEPQTVFGKWAKQGKIKHIDDEYAAEQFTILTQGLQQHGFEQYEISNFARHQQYSKHNTSYWKQEEYLGIGPSAHSFNGYSRQYNIANNAKYIQHIQQNNIPATVEVLSIADQVNEYLLTGLRTIWGCQVSYLDAILGESFLQKQAKSLVQLQAIEHIAIQNQVIKLTEKGKLFADRIASDLFLD
jgi:oxygen-independent coproporphyrinogen-3 oxidase